MWEEAHLLPEGKQNGTAIYVQSSHTQKKSVKQMWELKYILQENGNISYCFVLYHIGNTIDRRGK